MNRVISTIALLLLTCIGLWAGEVIKVVKPNAKAGTVVSTVSDGVCTLTVTPATGFYLTADNLKAVATLNESGMQAPRRDVQIDFVEEDELEITPTNPDANPSGVTTYWFYMPEDENLNVEVTAEFQVGSCCELKIGGVWVTAENAGDIQGGGIDGNVSFDIENKILTLENTFISMESFADFPIVSSYDNLTIKLVGSSTINPNSDYFYFVKYSGEELAAMPQLTFVLDDGVHGSLELNGIYSLEDVANGYDVTNTFMSAEDNATSTGWLFFANEEEGSLKLWYQLVYGIVVMKGGYSYIITQENKSNVLGEFDIEEPSVKFDGHGRLVLNNAELTSILVASNNNLPIVDPQNKTKGLEIYLEGESTITNDKSYAIYLEDDEPEAALHLTFLTSSSDPGTLSCTGDNSGASEYTPFTGFDVEYKNNLVLTKSDNTATVKTPLGLIVDEVESTSQKKTTTINYGDVASAGIAVTTGDLTNLIANNMLYTLNDQREEGKADDGYDGTRNQLVINSIMTDGAVAELHADVIAGNVVPGTGAYAARFKGLTFVVPAGTGKITLNTNTEEGYEFHLKVGAQDPIKVVNKTDNGNADFETTYTVTTSTYVYFYLVATGTSSAPAYAQAVGGHRIGPKSSVAGGLGGISVQGNVINVAPNPAASYLMMTATDYANVGRGIKVNNSDVTDLPVSAFSAAVSPSPRRAPDANMKTYIDVSETKITGKSYSRTEGAFKDVPEETLIYLPAGNTAVGKNFIIGGICENLELKATRENPFEAAADFTVAKATFDREFVFKNGDEKCYTIFLPYALKVGEVDGELFEYVSYDSATETVNMTKLSSGSTTPNKAYIFKPSKTSVLKPMLSTEVKKLTGTAGNPSDESEAEGLHGVYEYYTWTSKPSNVYCYSATDKDGILQGQFAKVGANTHIKPFRAYLRLNTSSAPEFISVDWGDGMTSIVPLEKEQIRQDADGWYTITGFRLPNKPTEKGIYIHNQKKTVVK